MTDISFFESLQQHQGSSVVFNGSMVSGSPFFSEPSVVSVCCMNAGTGGPSKKSIWKRIMWCGVGALTAAAIVGHVGYTTGRINTLKQHNDQLTEKVNAQEQVIGEQEKVIGTADDTITKMAGNNTKIEEGLKQVEAKDPGLFRWLMNHWVLTGATVIGAGVGANALLKKWVGPYGRM